MKGLVNYNISLLAEAEEIKILDLITLIIFGEEHKL
jgi:hypothetical protein